MNSEKARNLDTRTTNMHCYNRQSEKGTSTCQNKDQYQNQQLFIAVNLNTEYRYEMWDLAFVD
jgi:hypothetical protein